MFTSLFLGFFYIRNLLLFHNLVFFILISQNNNKEKIYLKTLFSKRRKYCPNVRYSKTKQNASSSKKTNLFVNSIFISLLLGTLWHILLNIRVFVLSDRKTNGEFVLVVGGHSVEVIYLLKPPFLKRLKNKWNMQRPTERKPILLLVSYVRGFQFDVIVSYHSSVLKTLFS